jgi:hypothetical protein
MDLRSKLLLTIILVLTLLSVSATFYKTVILQDFDVTGAYIEFTDDESSYVWFVYENEEYELELNTTNYDEIISSISEEIGIDTEKLPADFLEYLNNAYDDAQDGDTDTALTEN